MRSGLADFTGKSVRGHMPVAAVKQKARNQQALPCRAQPGGAQAHGQIGLTNDIIMFHSIDHSVQKHVGSATPCQ